LRSGLFRVVILANVYVVCVSAAFAQDETKAKSSPTNKSGKQLSSPQVPKLKMPGPEAQNLMLGAWAIKAEYAPSKEMPNGGTGEGIEVWRSGPGDYFVIEEYHEKNPNGVIDGFAQFWWDADLQGQRFVWCDDTNPRGCELSKNVAKWEGDRLVYREDRVENGKNITHQEVFEDITPVSFSQILAEGPAGGELRRIVTIHAARILGRQ
jgi:hypothetical protein